MGPVQVLVVGFDRPSFSGDVLEELTRLREAGIVRLVDVLLVSHAEDGTLKTLDARAEWGADLGTLAAEFFGQPEGRASSETEVAGAGSAQDSGWSLADAVPVGSTAVVALLEHVWAGPLSAAIKRAGGVPLEESWLAPADLKVLETLVARRQG
jgi:Family of unknown function (DUF6325)